MTKRYYIKRQVAITKQDRDNENKKHDINYRINQYGNSFDDNIDPF